MPHKIRLATIGTGFFSQFHYDAWHRLDVELVGICSLDHVAAEKVAERFGNPPLFHHAAEMLTATQPDLVDVIVPPKAQVDVLDAVFDAGVDAICQKPFTPDLATAIKTAETAKRAGIKLIIHENFRFQPWHQEIRRILVTGQLGDVFQSTFRLRPGDGQGPRAYLDRQPYFQDMPRFLVHETAIHLIDVFRYHFSEGGGEGRDGGEVVAVTADLRQLNPALKGEDAGLIILEFANGRRALFDGNRLVDHVAENRRLTMGEMWVEGSAATLRLDGAGSLRIRDHGSNEERAHDYEWRDHAYAGDCVYQLQAHVLAHITSGTPLMNRAEDYLTNLRIEEACYRSASEHRRVIISEI